MSTFPGFIHRGILPRPFITAEFPSGDVDRAGPDPRPTRSRDFLASIADPATYPVKVWDGATITLPDDYAGTRGAPGLVYPTSVAGKFVDAVGPLTDYALKLTPAEFATYFWRIAEIGMVVREFSAHASSGGFSVSSGHYESSGPPDFTETWVSTSFDVPGSSIDLSAPLDLAFEGYDHNAVRISRIVQEGDALFERRLLNGGPRFTALALGSDDIRSSFLVDGYSAEDVHHDDDVAADGDGQTEVHLYFRAGSSAGSGDGPLLYWPLGGLNGPAPFHFVDGFFWLPLPIPFSWRADASAFSIFYGDGEGAHSPVETATKNFQSGLFLGGTHDVGSVIEAASGDDSLKVELAFSPTHIVAAEFLTFKQDYTTSTDGGVGGSSLDVTLSQPIVRVTPVKYFTYGGRYDESTGERAS